MLFVSFVVKFELPFHKTFIYKNTGITYNLTMAEQRKKIILLAVVLAVASSLMYIGTTGYDFLKDDFRLIVENPRIKEFDAFINSIHTKFFSFPDFPYLHYWRPLTLFTFFIDYKIWGLNPGGFHAANILWNTCNAVLIFLVFYFASGKVVPPFFIALFFSIHPTHAETVSWISGRTDLLASFFVSSALLFFILFLKKKKWPLYVLSILCFTLALLSKENAALFPLAAAGAIFMLGPGTKETKEKQGRNYLLLIPMAAIDILYVIMHNSVSGVQNITQNVSLNDAYLIFKTIGVYGKMVLTPFPFPFLPVPYFPMGQIDRNALEFSLYALIALALVGVVILKRDKFRFSFFALLFFIFLLPVLDPQIVPTNPRIALRFAYIPAVFAGAFFMDILPFFKNKIAKYIYIGFLAVIACTWVVESVAFQGYFKNKEQHYRLLVDHYPDDGSILLPLALQNAETGNYAEALKLVNHALEVNEKDRWMDVSETGGLLKANLLVVAGDSEEGKTLAEKILVETEKQEMKYFAFLVLGKYYEKKQEYAAAVDQLKAGEAVGETADLFYRMTIVYVKMKDFDNALLYLEKARDLSPDLPRYSELKQFILNQQKRSVTGD